MKKIWLSIWLCLCLLAGITGVATAASSITITQDNAAVTLADDTQWIILSSLPADPVKGDLLGWAQGASEQETSWETVAKSATNTVTAIYEPGVHPVSVFKLNEGKKLNFFPVYKNETGDGAVGGVQFIEALDWSYDIPIYAQYLDNTTLDTPLVFKVEIEWGDMEFALGDMTDGLKIWNPYNHTYTWEGAQPGEDEWYLVNAKTYLGQGKDYSTKAVTNAGSTGIPDEHRTQANILVFNHSNSPLDAKIQLVDHAVDGVTMGLQGIDGYGVGANYVVDQPLVDDAVSLSTYTCTLFAGSVGQDKIHDATTAARASAIAKVWPTSDEEDANRQMFATTTPVAQLTIIIDPTPYPEGATVYTQTTTDDSQG